MADVLIQGMEKMPGNCRECMFAGFGGMRNELNVCMFSGESQSLISHERMSKCPLVPLPEGHGRLGDLDALEAKFREEALEHTLIGDLNRMTLGVGEVIDRIRMADTIIPAEGGTDECSEN